VQKARENPSFRGVFVRMLQICGYSCPTCKLFALDLYISRMHPLRSGHLLFFADLIVKLSSPARNSLHYVNVALQSGRFLTVLSKKVNIGLV